MVVAQRGLGASLQGGDRLQPGVEAAVEVESHGKVHLVLRVAVGQQYGVTRRRALCPAQHVCGHNVLTVPEVGAVAQRHYAGQRLSQCHG